MKSLKIFLTVTFLFCSISGASETRNVVGAMYSHYGPYSDLAGDYVYSLWGTIPFQKIDKGYLLKNGGPGGDDLGEDVSLDPVFLYTNRDIPEGHIFAMNEMATYAGEYEYQTLSGFTHKIHAFKLISNKNM